MDRGRTIGLVLILAFVLASCTGSSDPGESSTSTQATPQTVTTGGGSTATTAAWVAVAPTIEVATPDFTKTEAGGGVFSAEVVEFSDVSAELLSPVGSEVHGAVVLVHGGGYTGGNPELMHDLAAYLAANGFIAINTGYQLATTEEAAFPDAIDDVACAVRLAATHERSNAEVTVLGVSAGAHFATLVALVGDQYGDGCPEQEPVLPQQLVALGLPGPIDGTAQPTFLYGETQDDAPDLWAEGDPLQHLEANTSLRALFLHAESDSSVSSETAERAFVGLLEAGASADYGVVPRIGHFNLNDPRAVGAAVVAWLGS